ncbi:MAG TPA: response regulator [Gemmatimonadales bacterium]|nr:response regulator [Gemmatimonadales bacterium]
MSPRPFGFAGRYIVVADEDRSVTNFVIEVLLQDGHAVFMAYDGLSATHLVMGLKVCDLLISNSRVAGLPGVELIRELRQHLPYLPVLYLANDNRSNATIERGLPGNVPILREPFSADDLRRNVRGLLETN